MSEFNVFRGGIKNEVPTGTTTLDEVIEWIRSDRYQADVAQVRAQDNKKAATFYKKQLDYVTPSGVFAPKRMASMLKKHSGLMVLDFDHLPDVAALRIQFQTDPYVAACFVSPSGTGLKVLVKIKDPDRHKEVYADLAHYFNSVYRLTEQEQVDISGSDPSRACFLSHDPEAYLNPKPKTYAIRNAVPPKPKTEYQLAQDATDVERHIAAVVERIEHHQMDICSDYSTEWLLIAFSMSVLGESGRAYFHRVSRLNAKYEEKDADEKFDNAIKTSRFTTPAKFFQICKDYGLDVSKPKRENAARPAKEEVPENEDGGVGEGKKPKKPRDPQSDWIGTVHYYQNAIYIKTSKFWENVAPNFQVFIKYRTEDEQELVTWVLEIRKDTGENEFIELLHDDFCSARKLKNMLATRSLGFKISDSHLNELHSYLFTETRFNTAMKVIRYGYHPASKVFFFSNKALNISTGDVVTPDEFGIVQANSHHLSIPQQTKARQLRYQLTDQPVKFQQFWNLYALAHLRENAFVPACFYVFSLFRDLGLQFKNFSPILFLKGGAGTGKSSMVRILTAAFGRKQEGVNLKSKNTDAALVKLMSQTSNSIIWFDEYHNELTNEGLLQAAYDNDGYHKSTTDFNSIDTATVHIHLALALTSNYLPENQIFFSRCVFVPITAQNKTDEQRKAFYALEDMQEGGMGSMTVELLRYRELLEGNDNYAVSYNRLYAALKKQFAGQSVPERLFANMAQIMAAPYTLNCLGKLNLLDIESDNEQEILEEYVEMGALFIMRQWRIMNESKAVAEFFEILQMLFDEHKIHDEMHFRFSGEMILLNFGKLYNLFVQKYRQVFYKSAPDRDTIQSELATLAGRNDWSEITKAIRFTNDGTGKSQATTIPLKGSCELTYKLLQQNFGVDFQNRTGNI